MSLLSNFPGVSLLSELSLNPDNIGPCHKKAHTLLHALNKGADQPAHLCSLISAFEIHYLYLLVKLAPCKITIFKLVSVAEQAGLSLTWSETLKTGFLVSRPF